MTVVIDKDTEIDGIHAPRPAPRVRLRSRPPRLNQPNCKRPRITLKRKRAIGSSSLFIFIKSVSNPSLDKMELRLLGKSGVKVSELCMGTMTFGDSTDEPSAHAMLDKVGVAPDYDPAPARCWLACSSLSSVCDLFGCGEVSSTGRGNNRCALRLVAFLVRFSDLKLEDTHALRAARCVNIL